MTNIAIIGAGQAGVSFLDAMKERSADFSLTLIDRAARYWDKHEFLTNFSLKEWRDLSDMCKDAGVNFVCDTVERINLSRKKIYFKEAQALDYDMLVVASGLQSKSITAKGEHREGVVYLSKIEPFKLRDLLKISNEAIVYVTTLLGIRLALALQAAGKEVRVLSNSLDFLDTYKERFLKYLGEKNVPVHEGVGIEELIGEGQVRATKITPLKVFSSQLVFIDSGFTRAIDFFEEPFTLNNVIETSQEGLFVIGDANRLDIQDELFFLTGHRDASLQAQALAKALREGTKPVVERLCASNEEKQRILEELIVPKEYSKIVLP